MYFFEASSRTRILQVACAVVWCLFGAGPIFGFAALKPTLVDQGVYRDACNVNSTVGAAEPGALFTMLSTLSPLGGKDFSTEGFAAECTEQDLKLNMMFTVGAVLTNISALVIGRTLDAYGPRVCGLIGAAFLFCACYVFIHAKSITLFDPYLVGYAAMALGGPFSYISSFQLSNAFPGKSGLVLALLTGAFDTSSAVFLLYKMAYLRNPVLFRLENFYKVYLLIPVFITIVQLTIMPKESYLTPPMDLIPNPTPEEASLATAAAQEEHLHEANEATALLGAPSGPQRRSSIGEAYKAAYVEDEIEEHTKGTSSSIFGILHGFPASYQFRTYWFVLICLFATIQMLRLNYFVATINSQYTYLLGSYAASERLNVIFDIALPLGGVISIPFVGMFLDSFPTSIVLDALFGVSIVIGVLGAIKHSFLAGVLNVLLFVCYRPFFYTSISDYCAKVFGFETFGTVYGSIMTISGIVNFLQSSLDRLTHTTFKMNPIPLNLLLLSFTLIIGGTTVVYVTIQSKVHNDKKSQSRSD